MVQGKYFPGLRCDSDADSKFKSICHGEHLVEIGAVPSFETVGDSFDKALVETVNKYSKDEFVPGPDHPGPWKSIEELELATLGSVNRYNIQRLHGFIGDIPPAEFKDSMLKTVRKTS